MLGRPHVAVIAAILGVGLTWSRRAWAPALRVAVPTAAALGVLMLWNRWLFGSFSIGGAYQGRLSSAVSGFGGDSMSGGSHAQLLNYLGFLVAPDRGFLVWSPIVLLLLPAVVRTWKSTPDWSRWLFVGGVVYSFFQLRLNNFTGGDAFYGYRLGLELVTCIVPVCLVAALKAGPTLKRMLPALLGLQAGAIAWGAVTETFFLPPEDVWRDNSLWLALRHFPVVVVVWLLLWTLGAVLVARRLHDRGAGSSVAPVASALEA
jgi:alpha-1,2-mannosyltransferase